jgi:hypothetical protein
VGKDGRFRIRKEIWLDANNPDDQMLLELIDVLKEKRLLTDTLRDGLWIVHDLRNGRLDELLKRYSWVGALLSIGQGGLVYPTVSTFAGLDDIDIPEITVTPQSGEAALDNFLDSLDELDF